MGLTGPDDWETDSNESHLTKRNNEIWQFSALNPSMIQLVIVEGARSEAAHIGNLAAAGCIAATHSVFKITEFAFS
jgi:hypothetical protein